MPAEWTATDVQNNYNLTGPMQRKLESRFMPWFSPKENGRRTGYHNGDMETWDIIMTAKKNGLTPTQIEQQLRQLESVEDSPVVLRQPELLAGRDQAAAERQAQTAKNEQARPKPKRPKRGLDQDQRESLITKTVQFTERLAAVEGKLSAVTAQNQALTGLLDEYARRLEDAYAIADDAQARVAELEYRLSRPPATPPPPPERPGFWQLVKEFFVG